MTNVRRSPFIVQAVYILSHFILLHPRLALRQTTSVKDDPSSHETKSWVLRTHGWDCLATRACAGTKLRKGLKLTFLWSLEPALCCNAFSSMIVSTVVPVFICPQSPQNKRRKLTIHDGSSSRAHTNQPHGLGQ